MTVDQMTQTCIAAAAAVSNEIGNKALAKDLCRVAKRVDRLREVLEAIAAKDKNWDDWGEETAA